MAAGLTGPCSSYLAIIGRYEKFRGFLCASVSANDIVDTIRELMKVPIGSITEQKAQEADLLLRRMTTKWFVENFSEEPEDVVRNVVQKLKAAKIPQRSYRPTGHKISGYDFEGFVLTEKQLHEFEICGRRFIPSRKISLAYFILRGQELDFNGGTFLIQKSEDV